MEIELKIEVKKARGGKRDGAGRKSFENARNHRTGFMLSKKAMENLARAADENQTTRNDYINRWLESLYT